jgi:hypothetical protein
MKRTFAILALVFLSTIARSQSIQRYYFGAWWITSAPIYDSKPAGLFLAELYDDNTVQIQKATTLTNLVTYTGTWRFKSPNVAIVAATNQANGAYFISTDVNFSRRTIFGRHHWFDRDGKRVTGRFQATHQATPEN